MTRQKPPHLDTVELSVEDLARGQREQQYSEWLRAYRVGDMSESEWQEHLLDKDFLDWARGL